MNDTPTILIVGAGPVGLMLGLVLAEHGLPFRIIDKRERWSDASKALTITPRTLETLGLVGVARRFVEEGIASRRIHFFDHRRRRIAGIDFGGLASPYPFLLQLPQNVTLRLLVEALAEKGVEVERPLILEEIEEGEDGRYECRVKEGGGEKRQVLHARYVIGCDGSGSTVREAVGGEFSGGQAKEAFIMADVKMENHPFADERYMFYLRPKGSLYVMPLSPGYHRLISTTDRPAETVDEDYVVERLQEIFAQLGLEDIRLSHPLWISAFNPRQFVVERYRKGNVFLAGDAAHIQSPVGSQGLNTGIQDAANLGWKLAFALKSWASEEILATYDSERRRIALQLFEYNDRLSLSVFGSHRLLRGWAISKRYSLNIPCFQRKEARTVAQLGLRYAGGPVREPALPGREPRPADTRRARIRVGERFPAFRLSHGSVELSSYELLRLSRYTVFVFTRDVSSVPREVLDQGSPYRTVCLISCGTTGDEPGVYRLCEERMPLLRGCLLCSVRPDSYVEEVRVLD